ncbi:MAG: NYN domain-containing protein [archaeon]
MKVIIFNDTQNFNGSLNFINDKFNEREKRFWNYKRYIPFLIKKLKSTDNLVGKDLQLVKVYFYEGKYSSNMINNLKWSCNQKISELNKLINEQQNILNAITQEKTSRNIRRKISSPINKIKIQFEKERERYLNYIEKQKRNFEGQRELFAELGNNSLIDVKTTPLKQKEGEVYQKGVDVLLAIDLIHLAHIDAYDIAIILSGDTDLIEAVRLIKTLGKTPVIFSYHTAGNPKRSNISDLMTAGKFINLKDLTTEEIMEISDLRKDK